MTLIYSFSDELAPFTVTIYGSNYGISVHTPYKQAKKESELHCQTLSHSENPKET